MNFRIIMIATAVATIAFGAGFIISPASLSSVYGLSSTPTNEFVLRLYAMALIGIGLLAWLFRQSQNRDTQKRLLLAFFVTDFGGFIVALFAKLAGMMNMFGWSLVVLLLLFSAAYAYSGFAQQATR